MTEIPPSAYVRAQVEALRQVAKLQSFFSEFVSTAFNIVFAGRPEFAGCFVDAEGNAHITAYSQHSVWDVDNNQHDESLVRSNYVISAKFTMNPEEVDAICQTLTEARSTYADSLLKRHAQRQSVNHAQLVAAKNLSIQSGYAFGAENEALLDASFKRIAEAGNVCGAALNAVRAAEAAAKRMFQPA
jgi:hypothetical protein